MSYKTSLKIEAINRFNSGEPIEQIADDLGVSKRSIWLWKQKLMVDGESALINKSTKPTNNPRAITDEVTELIFKKRDENFKISASQIARDLTEEGFPISHASVLKVLKSYDVETRPINDCLVEFVYQLMDKNFEVTHSEVIQQLELLGKRVSHSKLRLLMECYANESRDIPIEDKSPLAPTRIRRQKVKR